MTVMEWDTTQPQASATSFEVLPTDIYVMTIAEAAMEDDKFAEVDREGNAPQKLVLKWETSKLTAEQQEAGIGMGEPVWHRFNPYYGTVKAGGPSKFKAFVDSLIEQKLLPARFTPADFVGIVQRVSVEEYTKTMGANVGKPGNRITAVAPLQPVRRAQRPMVQPASTPTVTTLPTEGQDADDLPF
jgi:hypothetical protein